MKNGGFKGQQSKESSLISGTSANLNSGDKVFYRLMFKGFTHRTRLANNKKHLTSDILKMETGVMQRGVGGSTNIPIPPKPVPKPGHVKVVRALYKYTAQQPDELTFQEGDLLYVFDQVTDPSWWKARCGNKTGLIPSNYVESQTEEVDHPLHEAARRGNLSFLLECLQHGVSGTGLDNAGNTPLYWASRGGHIDCVRELLSLSYTALDAQNKVGDTPLHAAASHGHLEVVELLLSHNADSSLVNKDNQMPVDLSMDAAVTNVLQLSQMSGRPNSNSVVYEDDDYADESD